MPILLFSLLNVCVLRFIINKIKAPPVFLSKRDPYELQPVTRTAVQLNGLTEELRVQLSCSPTTYRVTSAAVTLALSC